jgi:glutamate dehydrogenase
MIPRMRRLRAQLIELLTEAAEQQQYSLPHPRIAASLVHDFMQLLVAAPKRGQSKQVALTARTLSHDWLHRHILCIRCPDQAFYLDAIKGYLQQRAIAPLALQALITNEACDENQCTIALYRPGMDHSQNIMFIALHVSATLVPDLDDLVSDLRAILRAVNISVSDFDAMRDRLNMAASALSPVRPEDAALLHWMLDNKYLMFGLRHGTTRLGVLRDKRTASRVAGTILGEADKLLPASGPGLEWLPLPTSHQHMYSPAMLEVVRINWPGQTGVDSLIMIGHFSRSARYTNASYTPMLEQYWKTLEEQPLLRQSTFYRRELRTLFDRMPKPTLLSTRPTDWLKPLKSMADMTDDTALVARYVPSRFGGVGWLAIALSASRFGPNVLTCLRQYCDDAGISTYGYESFGSGQHRILVLSCDAGEAKTIDARMATLETQLRACILFWKDKAKAAALQAFRSIQVPGAMKTLDALSPLYAGIFPPEQFVSDLQARDHVLADGRPRVTAQLTDGDIEFHIVTREPILLGRLVTSIQNFGLTAIREAVVEFGEDSRRVHISSIRCQVPQELIRDDLGRLQTGLQRVLADTADDDAVNSLLISGGLTIDQIAVIITLRNHLIQIMPDAAPTPMTQMLCRHPAAASCLYRLFEARHRPAMPASYEPQARLEFDKALDVVTNLTDDRWLRAMGELVEASTRTNAYTREPEEPVAIKIMPRRLGYMPAPAPYREIFVHGVHVEGVHLRAGPIARGGIRYSDRPSDFRTEVLELMATQVVKNGQIVPTGAKGGFVLRGGSGEDFVRTQYRNFIRALLTLTDNYIHQEAVPPTGIRIHPEDMNDPYLVVAADKGTARYSDLANEESRLAGFWLDDAFASGGSHGYDHKQIGITARGAWVCVAHHFAHLGIDAWHDPITAIGIGDMGGDVFGNGMLLNPALRLIGAFNHRHIFLDPSPDSGRAFAERQRLFREGGGWDAYDPSLISRGGGVFDRSAKRIPIGEAAAAALGTKPGSLSGQALIQAMLAAPVDLLYNGGIGTYVKGEQETHAEVRDPANNAVRVDGSQLQAKVVGEGGNLGFTQLARMEFARAGGRINTDAIDNSAGVDMSDHEVNLKIMFGAAHPPISQARRNRILEGLTEAVTGQCLNDNHLQSHALSLAAYNAQFHLPRLRRLCNAMLEDGRLDAQRDPGLDEESLVFRPQLAVLLGHEKNRIREALARDGFARWTALRSTLLEGYFPEEVLRRHKRLIPAHPLADDIVHTEAADHVVNHIGITAVHHLESLLDVPIAQIVEALLIADRLLDAQSLRQAVWSQIEDAETTIQIQHTLADHVMHFAEELARLCTITDLDLPWIQRQWHDIRHFRHSIAGHGISGMEQSAFLDMLKTTTQAGLETDAAEQLATMPELAESATALYLSMHLKLPLRICLQATQACLHLLPITALEMQLRSSDWNDDEAHALRREWLHRLTHLKAQATGQLLAPGTRDMVATGELLWSGHHYWPNLMQTRTWLDAENDAVPPSRTEVMLALAQLESLLDESNHRDGP